MFRSFFCGNVKVLAGKFMNVNKIQHSKTNVKYFLFHLLRIKGLYMFRALLAHLQEALHKRHLVYCVRVMSVGCTRIGVEWSGCLTTEYSETTAHFNGNFDTDNQIYAP
jgi:hypothetical protein